MKDVRAIYYKITGQHPKAIVPLYGGLNSVNYLIDQGAVLRIKTATIDELYNPVNEYRAERLLINSGLTPQLLHFDQTTGIKLTRYLPNTSFLSKPPTVKQLISVAKALKQLHALPIVGIDEFKPIARYEIYKRASKLSTSTTRETSIVAEIKKKLETTPCVFAHNDLVRGNLLFDQDELYIIDYEYAGLNHPLFDLASFITENNIDDSHLIEIFLMAYYQEKNIPKHDFEMFCRFLDYLWFYWAQGMYMTTNLSIYKSIAQNKWRRISNL